MSARRFWKPLSASLRSASKSNYLVQGKTVYNPVAQVFTILLLTGDAGPYNAREDTLSLFRTYREKHGLVSIIVRTLQSGGLAIF